MLIYITGGARSGKSRYAVERAHALAKKVTFVATWLTSKDKEMDQRIQRHRDERPAHWQTIENRIDLAEIIAEQSAQTELLLIDCLTMFVSGRLMDGENEAGIVARVEKLCQAAARSSIPVILVSNEVGSGVVPDNELARLFQDCLGRANQIAARHAQEAVAMISGFPITLNGKTHGC